MYYKIFKYTSDIVSEEVFESVTSDVSVAVFNCTFRPVHRGLILYLRDQIELED